MNPSMQSQPKNGHPAQNGNISHARGSIGSLPTESFSNFNLFSPKQALGQALQQMVQPRREPGKGADRGRAAVRIKRPLIVIGAGGTGRWVVTMIKALLLQMFGTIPENVVLIAFDSGAEVINTRDEQGRTVQLENGNEFLSLGKVPIAGIKRNPAYQSELANRLGEGLFKIYRQSIVDGCSQNRIEGIATLYYHFDAVFSALGRAIQRVTARNNDPDETGEDAQKINIVLIGSTAGGQGSGILLDLALLVRELLSIQGGWEDTAQLTGFFSLPSAFNDVKERDKRNMAPNTVAFLRELEMLQRGERIEMQYPNRVLVRNVDAPFDHVYVLEGIDERGFVWSNQRDVCHMVARCIVLLTAGQVGMAEIAFALNQQAVLMNTSRTGYRSYLASPGLSELYYPGDRVLNVALLRHLYAMLTSALQPPPDVAEVATVTPEAPAWTLAQLVAQLQNGIASRVQIQLPADLREGDVAQIPVKARDYVVRLKTKRVYELLFSQLDQQASKVLAQYQATNQRWLDRLSSVPALPLIQHALRTSMRQLSAQISLLLQEQKTVAAEIEHKKREATAADVAMVQAVESFFFGRKERTLNAVNHFVDEAEQAVQLEVRERELTLVQAILQRLAAQLEEFLTLIDDIALRLQALAQHSQAEEQRLLATPMSQNVINLADADLIDALYQFHAPAAVVSLQAALVKANGWWQLGQQADETLVQQFQAAAAPAFQTLATLNVEDVLQQRWPDRSATAWVNLLGEKAAVAWNVDRAKLPPGAESLAVFLTLGVPDADNSIFSKSGQTCTSTGDPQRIIALRTVYGGAIDSLKSLARWEVEYQAAIKANLPIHLFGNFEPNKDRVLSLLGLGLLFEFLRRKQTWFIYQPEDVLDKAQQVAQGLEKTIEALTSNAMLLGELERRVHSKIVAIGNAQAALLIQQWLDQQQARDEELFTAVLRAVRSFADQLKA